MGCSQVSPKCIDHNTVSKLFAVNLCYASCIACLLVEDFVPYTKYITSTSMTCLSFNYIIHILERAEGRFSWLWCFIRKVIEFLFENTNLCTESNHFLLETYSSLGLSKQNQWLFSAFSHQRDHEPAPDEHSISFGQLWPVQKGGKAVSFFFRLL